MNAFRLAWLSLVRRKVPTLIALVAIALSVGVSGVLLRFYELSGARFRTMGAGGDAVVGAKAGGLEILLGSLNGEGADAGYLPMNLYRSLANQAEVHFEDGASAHPTYAERVIPILYFGSYRNFPAVGTEASFLTRPRREDSLDFAEGAWGGPGEVVLGARAGSGAQVGDRIAVTTQDEGREVPMRVSGILKPTGTTWDRLVYANIVDAQSLLPSARLRENSSWGPNVFQYALVYLKPGGLDPLLSLVNRRTVAQVISVPREKERLAELTGTGRTLGLLVTLCIMLLGGLSVAAMLVTRFEAMNVQFAVLRALGYGKRSVAAWLLSEGLLLGIAACGAGAVLDGIAFPFLRGMMGSALPDPSLVPSSLFASWPVWVTSLAATTLAALIPLVRLYRQNVHASLQGG